MEKARGITAINSTSALKKDEEGLRNVATETAPLIFYGLNVGKMVDKKARQVAPSRR